MNTAHLSNRVSIESATSCLEIDTAGQEVHGPVLCPCGAWDALDHAYDCDRADDSGTDHYDPRTLGAIPAPWR